MRQNTTIGNGRANSSDASHRPLEWNAAMSSLAVRRTIGSTASIWAGANDGSRIRRYFCSMGGSMSIGIKGRRLPKGGNSMLGATENVSGSCSARKMSSYFVRNQNPP
jgi:hypothetical protein